MIIYHFIQYSLLIIICTYLVNYYSAKTVSFHIKFWSIITWTLNFALALLVPQDVYQTFTDRNKQPPTMIESHQSQLSSLGWQYLVLYWLVYLLTWTIIPVLQQWQNSGDLQSSDRLKRSLKSNGIFYLYMLVGAIIFLVILFITGVGGQMGLITFLKCLATIWGLLLLMGLMGYALVQVPKTLWNNAQPIIFLHYLYKKSVQVQDQLQQAYQEFTKVTGYVLYCQKNAKEDEQIQLYCTQSLKIIPLNLNQKINSNYERFLNQINYIDQNPINLESSIQHLRLLKRSIARCARLQKSLEYYLKLAILYEDILQSQKQNSPNLSTKIFKVQWYHSIWYLKVRKYFNKILALIIGTGSVILLISQTQVFLTNDSSILAWMLSIRNYQLMRIMVFIVIVFITYMANYSLFRLKLANLYGLYKKNSDGPSLMFATVNFSRVGVVIVLNFFDMMKMDSEYQRVMGTVNMGLLGEWVIKGLPGVLWLIVLTHYFNFWGKLMNKLKLNNMLTFSSHDGQEMQTVSKSPYIVLKKRAKVEQQYSRTILQS